MRGSLRRRLLGRGQRPVAGLPTPARTPPRHGTDAAATVRACVNAALDPGEAGRPVVRLTGTLRAVTEQSVAGLPALRAELDDGTGSCAVVWLGRRAIPGVEPGRVLVVSGRIAMTHGRPVLFNPRYELRPQPPRGTKETA